MSPAPGGVAHRHGAEERAAVVDAFGNKLAEGHGVDVEAHIEIAVVDDGAEHSGGVAVDIVADIDRGGRRTAGDGRCHGAAKSSLPDRLLTADTSVWV